MKTSSWGRRESNPHWRRFKRPASADWATSPQLVWFSAPLSLLNSCLCSALLRSVCSAPAVLCSGCALLRLCSAPAVLYSGCALLRLCSTPAVLYSGCALLRLWSAPAVLCSGCALLRLCSTPAVLCSGCGLLLPLLCSCLCSVLPRRLSGTQCADQPFEPAQKGQIDTNAAPFVQRSDRRSLVLSESLSRRPIGHDASQGRELLVPWSVHSMT